MTLAAASVAALSVSAQAANLDALPAPSASARPSSPMTPSGPMRPAAGPHDGGRVAGYFDDDGSCQAAGYRGQHRHRWHHFDCDRMDWGRSGDDRHGDRGRDDRNGDHRATWVLHVRG